MTLYDSSVLIDYLDGRDDAVADVEQHCDERAVAPELVLFEVYQGEVFRSEPADFDAVDAALEWLSVLDSGSARAAAELQADLRRQGTVLAPRDAFIAGTAKECDERLAVSDSDFEGIEAHLDVDFV